MLVLVVIKILHQKPLSTNYKFISFTEICFQREMKLFFLERFHHLASLTCSGEKYLDSSAMSILLNLSNRIWWCFLNVMVLHNFLLLIYVIYVAITAHSMVIFNKVIRQKRCNLVKRHNFDYR